MKAKLPSPVKLDDFYSYFEMEECLIFVGLAMGRAGLTEADILPPQRELLRDLQNPLDEEALADMLEYWRFDLERLYSRPRNGWSLGNAPAKPKIDVWVELTSKGNFKAEWFPQDDTFGDYSKSDFPVFRRLENRGLAYTTRPSNELFFLHGVQDLIHNLEDDYGAPSAALGHPLLAATAKVVERLKYRLDRHFDVRMRTDVCVSWRERDSPDASWIRESDNITSWDIIDPAEVQRQKEIEILENLEATFGFSEDALLKAQIELVNRKAKTGPAPSPQTLSERLAREMKRQGYPATKGKVEHALALIEKYRNLDNVIPLTR